MNRKISLQYVSMQFRLRIIINYEQCLHTNSHLEVIRYYQNQKTLELLENVILKWNLCKDSSQSPCKL